MSLPVLLPVLKNDMCVFLARRRHVLNSAPGLLPVLWPIYFKATSQIPCLERPIKRGEDLAYDIQF